MRSCNVPNTRYHGVELGQVICGKQIFGCGIYCNKGRMYSFFHTIVLERKSNQSQSIPKIWNVF